MSARGRRLLWLMLVTGTIGRVLVAFTTRGVWFDIRSFELTRGALATHPLQVYSIVNTADVAHWPYPPGFFPWIVLSGWLHDATGLAFDGLIQVAPIIADGVIAWLVQAYLGRRCATERTRLSAVALVSLGPSFAVISGYHAQIDSVAILFAVGALTVWEHRPSPHRAWAAGLLIGIGGAVKVVPFLMVLALLPSARSARERFVLVASAAGVIVVVLAPFLLADPDGTLAAMTANRGLPGFGGISLLIQPGLARVWLGTGAADRSGLASWVYGATPFIAGTAMLLTGALLLVRRPSARDAAPLIWLVVYVFGVNFEFQFVIWGLPFLLLAGRIVTVAAVEALLLVPMLILYVRVARDLPWEYVYAPLMILAWAVFVYLLVREARRTLAAGRP